MNIKAALVFSAVLGTAKSKNNGEVAWSTVNMKTGVYREKPIQPRDNNKKSKKVAEHPILSNDDFQAKVEEKIGVGG
tara:strand:- start:228 stop:458 length:231 start_codon:yes stop_codon:yes gene_type:complete